MSDPNAIKLATGVEVISIQNALNFYPRNLLAEIFHFRSRHLRELNWRDGSISYTSIPKHSEVYEADSHDTPGTIYFTKSDCLENIVGTVRLSPSVDIDGKIISMLGTDMPDIVDRDKLPQIANSYEASRLVLDKDRLQTKEARAPIINELLKATVLFAIENGIKEFFGVMDNSIWKSTYERLGFDLTKIGNDKQKKDVGYPAYTVSARIIKFNEELIRSAKADSSILNFGVNPKSLKV